MRIIEISVPVTRQTMILKMKRSAQIDLLINMKHDIVVGRRGI